MRGIVAATVACGLVAAGVASSSAIAGDLTITRFKGNLYFGARNGAGDCELWRSGGTGPTTTLFKNLNPTADGSPLWFERLGKKLFFQARSAAHGAELWVSNGKRSGTRLFKDLQPGSESSDPVWLTRLGERSSSRLTILNAVPSCGSRTASARGPGC